MVRESELSLVEPVEVSGQLSKSGRQSTNFMPLCRNNLVLLDPAGQPFCLSSQNR
jgi:hypothetical protein